MHASQKILKSWISEHFSGIGIDDEILVEWSEQGIWTFIIKVDRVLNQMSLGERCTDFASRRRLLAFPCLVGVLDLSKGFLGTINTEGLAIKDFPRFRKGVSTIITLLGNKTILELSPDEAKSMREVLREAIEHNVIEATLIVCPCGCQARIITKEHIKPYLQIR